MSSLNSDTSFVNTICGYSMAKESYKDIRYKRSRFATKLPGNRRYTASHFWAMNEEPNVWVVGMTKFATRMLGDIVEFEFKVEMGERVEVGQRSGWIEAFKALTDIYCVIDGIFERVNPLLEDDITLIDSDPYGKGWLYSVNGNPEVDSVDSEGYVGILDLTIDKMMAESKKRNPND